MRHQLIFDAVELRGSLIALRIAKRISSSTDIVTNTHFSWPDTHTLGTLAPHTRVDLLPANARQVSSPQSSSLTKMFLGVRSNAGGEIIILFLGRLGDWSIDWMFNKKSKFRHWLLSLGVYTPGVRPLRCFLLLLDRMLPSISIHL